ncbi:MAG: hypothetical protein JWM48_129 [Mycobacterium sp.]|nr:hypothetical protein [Mycobacterium sp.]MCW2743579.1 hypothetical protein [Mycobacterium sp.]
MPLTEDDVRRAALALPAVEEHPHFGIPSFRLRTSPSATAMLATLPGDGHAHVFVDEEAARAAEAEVPGCELCWWGKRVTGVRVDLAVAAPAEVEEFLTDAWLRRASARLRTANPEVGRP